jgi:DUF1365 family protein
MQPAIYFGTLRHRRFRPAKHEFSYPVMMAFLDIDRLPQLMRVSPFTSYNRWNWTAYVEKDHFGDPNLSLRRRLGRDARAHGVALPEGPIYLLTHLRYLGYCFNPVSFYYCYDRQDRLAVMMAEVSNTFGDAHNYWLWEANERSTANAKRYQCPKVLHVSPFMKMELDYTFVFTPPGDTLVAHMNTMDGCDTFFDATLNLQRAPWTAAVLHRALIRFPWMTLKVITAIHLEAFKLYFKRLRFYPSPAHGYRRPILATGGAHAPTSEQLANPASQIHPAENPRLAAQRIPGNRLPGSDLQLRRP